MADNDRFNHSLKTFIIGVFCEQDGTPSASRILMYLMAGIVGYGLIHIIHHIVEIKDPTTLGTWVSNLPIIVTSLGGFSALPYGLNKGTAMITDAVKSFTGGGNQTPPQK